MLLRTRLTLILSVLLVLVIGAILAAVLYRDRLEEARLADIAVLGQQAAWRDLAERSAEALAEAREPLLADLEATALAFTDPAVLAALNALAAADGPVEEVQLQGPDGRLIHATPPLIDNLPILDAQILDRLSSGEPALAGLRQDRPGRFVLAVAGPVYRAGELAGFLTVARDVAPLLRELSAELQVDAYLVSPRGRLVEGTDEALWSAAAPDIAARVADMRVVATGERLLLATGVPVEDMAGGLAGALVTLRDSTADLRAVQLLEQASLFAVAVFVVFALAAFYFYLLRAFRPIESSLVALEALSRGDLDVHVEEGGADEVGRIASAVRVFRQNAIALREQTEREQRRRRRQERLIRRELARLAGTLDEEGRAEIMADLDRALAEESDAEGARFGIARDAQLVTLARVLGQMSARISAQHQRLTRLVEELREAIVTRTKLAMLEQELEIARELQVSLLPAPLPAEASFELDAVMQAAKEVGGDFYDFFKLDARHLAVVIADVSGKGVPAAFFMAVTRTHVRSAAATVASPAETIRRVNDLLSRENEQMMFVTLFYGVLDLATGVLTYANAGHNPPFAVRASGAIEPLPRTGDPALGIVEDAAYGELETRFSPGDALFLYTDGVTEAFDVDGRIFEDSRLVEILEEGGRTLPADALNALVLERVARFERGADQTDDITLLALRFLGPAGAAAATDEDHAAAAE